MDAIIKCCLLLLYLSSCLWQSVQACSCVQFQDVPYLSSQHYSKFCTNGSLYNGLWFYTNMYQSEYLFFDILSFAWKVGDALGTSNHILVSFDNVSFAEDTSQWHIRSISGNSFYYDSDIKVKCWYSSSSSSPSYNYVYGVIPVIIFLSIICWSKKRQQQNGRCSCGDGCCRGVCRQFDRCCSGIRACVGACIQRCRSCIRPCLQRCRQLFHREPSDGEQTREAAAEQAASAPPSVVRVEGNISIISGGGRAERSVRFEVEVREPPTPSTLVDPTAAPPSYSQARTMSFSAPPSYHDVIITPPASVEPPPPAYDDVTTQDNRV